MYFQRSQGQGSRGARIALMLTVLAAASCSGSGSDGNNATGGAGSTGGSANPGSGGTTTGTGGTSGTTVTVKPFCDPNTSSFDSKCYSNIGTLVDTTFCCEVWTAVDACRAVGQTVHDPNPIPSSLKNYYTEAAFGITDCVKKVVASGKLPAISSVDDVRTAVSNSAYVTAFCGTCVESNGIVYSNDGDYGGG